MSKINMRAMLEAGVHFGHQTRYWNPQMEPYLFGERNKIHIINLERSLPLFNDAMNFLGRMAASKGTILFVGTKRNAQDITSEAAQKCGMPYVDKRWLGGMLTNFRTVKQSVKRLKDIEKSISEGKLEGLSKKERLGIERELEKLQRGLGGIKHMNRIPDCLFVVDVGHEKIAVSEAGKLGIPVVGVVDSNNTPEGVDYVIPGNDDSVRSINLYMHSAAEAIVDAKTSAQIDEAKEVIGQSESSSKPAKKKSAKITNRSGKIASGNEKPVESNVETKENSGSEVDQPNSVEQPSS